ncbi:hypothetical protein PsorP6_017948 [Peronosclerospora sorghi]|uniref:Uncharacterized protein n=1 Tax=Peronosclerospora sorghi TaxID=230839 RepID=A0ACC0WEB4_9STRA|nr:hypothetical protein PsorP6_017948 [Peronosclerospora sorghi]
MLRCLSPLLDTSKSKKPSTLPSRVETTDLAVYLQRLQQRNAICTLVDAFSANDQAFVNLWVFIVNGVQSGVPVDPPTGVLETQTGSWARLDRSLACTIQTHLFSTLSSILTCQLLSQDEFKRTKDKFFAIYAENFMDRCALFTDLSHKHMYLDETVPMPAFQLSLALIEPSHLLTVAVAIVKTKGGISSKCTTSAFNCTAKVLIASAVALEVSRIRGSLPTLQNSRETRATAGELFCLPL